MTTCINQTERRGQVTKECRVCRRSFTGPRRQPTCSRTCGKRMSRVLKNCGQCGAGMMLPPSIARDRRFCSRTCANRAAGDNRVKVASADCQHCAVRFKPKKPDRTTYCSRGCSFAAKRKCRLEVAGQGVGGEIATAFSPSNRRAGRFSCVRAGGLVARVLAAGRAV